MHRKGERHLMHTSEEAVPLQRSEAVESSVRFRSGVEKEGRLSLQEVGRI